MDILGIFRAKSQQLFWQRLPDDHVVDGSRGETVEKDQAYFVIRLREMYLLYARKLWRKYYPVLHGYTKHLQGEEQAVAGPGQLRELGDANLDRIVNLNHRLAGPTPYRGDDVTLLVGLYSVPGQDAARALVKTVGDLASLGGIALGQVPQIAAAVKAGVESILGLNDARLQMGVHDAFFRDNPLRAGFYVGASAPAAQVDVNRLWVKGGRLFQGEDPVVAKPYADYDYMVLAVERHDTRDDWPGLPGIAEYEAKFAGVLSDNALTVDDKRKKLGELWAPFRQALATSPYLTEPDREGIAHGVSENLKDRLKKLGGGNPFLETRAWRDPRVESKPAAAFDFLDVADYTDRGDAESVRRAQAALAGNPFRS
jgi:hypothetical protein